MRSSSPQSCATLTGMPMMTAAHNPTRSERRTRRGLRAPNACAASGATAETGPMPRTNPTNRIRCARPTAAMACSPRRPINARSVVIMAIWPSCVSAIGHASLIVSIMSVRHGARLGCAGAPAATMVRGNVMARHHKECRGKRKAGAGAPQVRCAPMKNSRLPSPPKIGEATMPRTRQPHEVTNDAISSHTAA